MCISFKNIKEKAFPKIMKYIPMMEFGEIKNLLDVLTKYGILEFCRLGFNRMKFSRTKLSHTILENQLSPKYLKTESIHTLPKIQYHNWRLSSQTNLKLNYYKIISAQRHVVHLV